MPANPLTPHTEFVLRMFLTDGQARNLRPRTIEYYRTQLTWFLGYVAQSGGATVEDITPYLVRAYLVYLQQERRWADASIHTAARAIRAFFKFLEAEGLIQESPMRRVKMPKADKSVKTPFSDEELRRLLTAACRQPTTRRSRTARGSSAEGQMGRITLATRGAAQFLRGFQTLRQRPPDPRKRPRDPHAGPDR